VLLLAAAGVTPARAGYSEGGAFRTPGYGARAWGMAGAAIVTVDDESAVSWNPAMLGLVDGNYAGASYINLVPGETARQSQLAYVHVLQRGGDTGTVARHVVGAMVTNLSLELGGGESYSENFLRLAYAFTPEELVTFAAAGDVFISRSDVAGFDALGSSVDFAVRLSLTEHVSLGLVARNAFSRYSYENGEDDEKTRAFVLGVGYDDIPYATLEADVVFDHEDLGRVVAGFESDYLFDLLSVRGGIAYLDAGSGRAVPHFGFGLQAIRDRLRIHYNANLDDAKAFEDTHRFSLSVSL
jgi:hypothetical protein